VITVTRFITITTVFGDSIQLPVIIHNYQILSFTVTHTNIYISYACHNTSAMSLFQYRSRKTHPYVT
jgi:hypothetical protein